MADEQPNPSAPQWFRALLDTSVDVYFRYTLVPDRRFVYLSPSVHALTGHTSEAIQADATICVGLIVREDRRFLRQVLRARRGLTLTLRLHRNGLIVPVTLRTVAVVRQGRVVAVEGVVAGATAAGTPVSDGVGAAEPTQQRLAALMYEVHDLLHRVMPKAPRPQADERSPMLTLGELQFDPERLSVSDAGASVALTSRELLVLRYLLQRPARVVTRQQLLTDVWGYRYTGDDRTVDVHISRLRRKLPSLRSRLVAIKHVGYRLDADEPTARVAAR